MTSGAIDGRTEYVGYRCLYPRCNERREDYFALAMHVESTHTTPEEIKRMVFRDRHGNVAGIPPHSQFRYFPEVGMSPKEVQEIIASVLAEEYKPDPLLSSAQGIGCTMPAPLEPYSAAMHMAPHYALTNPSTAATAQPYIPTNLAYTATPYQPLHPVSYPGQIVAQPASIRTSSKQLDLPLDKLYQATKHLKSGDQAEAAQAVLKILINKKKRLRDEQDEEDARQSSVRTIWTPNNTASSLAESSAVYTSTASTAAAPALQHQNSSLGMPTANAVNTVGSAVSSVAGFRMTTPLQYTYRPANPPGTVYVSTVPVSGGPLRFVSAGVGKAPVNVPLVYQTPTSSVARMLSVTPAQSPDSGRGSESSAEDSCSNQLSPANMTGTTLSTYAPSTASSRNVDDYELDDNSNNSWTYAENFSEEHIITQSKENAAKRLKMDNGVNVDKPFVCIVPGCSKQYKNMQGIKYHAKSSAHKVKKAYRCTCGKKYATDAEYQIHGRLCARTPAVPGPLDSVALSFNDHYTPCTTMPGSPMSPLVFVAHSPVNMMASPLSPGVSTPTLQKLLSRPVETPRPVLEGLTSLAGPLPPASVFATGRTDIKIPVTTPSANVLLNSLLDSGITL